MKNGAVIVAAGMSRRMKKFKPLLQIEGESMIRRVISTFHQMGINDIVVVTGYRAEELEAEISRTGVVCIRNENYETTQMFDSVKIGFSYMQDKCDRIFFAPADVPLFTLETALLVRDEPEGLIKIPICGGRDGHPVSIDCSLIPQILSYQGNRGLKGAMELGDDLVKRIEVDDPGIFMDADTPEDFQVLLEHYRKSAVHPEVRIRLMKENPFFGPGTARLLRQIDYCSSVTEASKRLGISYSKARTMIRNVEKEYGQSVVDTMRGGNGGGKAVLTPAGEKLLIEYEQLEANVQAFAASAFRSFN